MEKEREGERGRVERERERERERAACMRVYEASNKIQEVRKLLDLFKYKHVR
jgi:hypothetical protein